MPPEAVFQHAPTFPFEVEKLLGVGGYGQVFKARDPALDRPVAIKALRPELLVGPEAETLRRRFLQEARAAATLAHPGIATVYSVGEHDGRPFLAMEYLDGEDLESYSARRGRLRTAEVADIGLQLLDALGAAHRAGVVHRDIKPSNLMLLADGTVKVMDFGIARVAGKELVKTQAGSLIATPQFASPEQLSGETVDERSDLYSTAVVCYHLLARAFPHPADSLAKLFHRVMYEEPLPLAEHGVYSTPEWHRFLERGLAKSRDSRFQDATTMARELLALEPALPTRSGPHDSSPSEPQPDTLPLVTPRVDDVGLRTFHAARSASDPEGLVRSWLDTFPRRDLGRVGPTTVLPRLLDVPLHADPFVGALALGPDEQTVLLLAGGQILAASDPLEDESDLLEREAVEHLLLTPQESDVPAFAPIASFLRAWRAGEEPEQQSLEASYVDLPRMLEGLRDGPQSWVVQLEGASSVGLLVVQEGRVDGLVGGAWAETLGEHPPGGAQWLSWLRTVDARITLWRAAPKPDETWYRLAFAGTQLRVDGAPELGPALAATPSPGSSASDVSGALKISAGTDSQSGLAMRALSAPAGQALSWLLRSLPRALTAGERRKEWKYLAQWIPDVVRAALYERVGSGNGLFDAVTYDAQGKVLHLVVVAKKVDAALLERLTERVAAIKSEHEKRGDVGAVLLLAHEIERDAAESYGELLFSGRSNRWFGLDQSLGYHGFVRLSARRGYHLLLARASGAIEDAEPLWELGGGETS